MGHNKIVLQELQNVQKPAMKKYFIIYSELVKEFYSIKWDFTIVYIKSDIGINWFGVKYSWNENDDYRFVNEDIGIQFQSADTNL